MSQNTVTNIFSASKKSTKRQLDDSDDKASTCGQSETPTDMSDDNPSVKRQKTSTDRVPSKNQLFD
jgi:hypothetical protein